ncbi:uncharacterized protein [Rutidosis leptorrhynchoides]|uniref:uncharacterized protein n=1 Tax=Rutidosis leptorrhynchoides TaxID=125765 RepID=UPI003A9A58F7
MNVTAEQVGPNGHVTNSDQFVPNGGDHLDPHNIFDQNMTQPHHDETGLNRLSNYEAMALEELFSEAEICYYMVIAKLLSNRLKKVIPSLVDTEHSAFIKGRNILDGVLIANETLSFLKLKRGRGFIFKVDFEKAFDTLNWEFLIEIMRIMGFGSKWRKWILTCFKSTSISIFVNGSPTSEFGLERGVRQGDPLSPFLFILATEGLNVLTKNAVAKKMFSGVEVGADKVVISHLQYADDTIFFGTWSESNVRSLLNLLKCFELTTGLKINYHKSNLIGVGVEDVEVERIANLFGCKVGSIPFMYLGLPVDGNMKKEESWAPVVHKFEKRLSDWKARSVCFGRRLTLVKAVLNSLPLYCFSLSRAPPCVIKHLESVRRSFFWGGSGNKSKMAWVKWDDTILPYCKGGLNLGSLKCKNMALIGKWWWRFKTESNSLWVKVISSIYGSSGGLTLNDSSHFDSFKSIWNGIIKCGFDIEKANVPFRKLFVKDIGDGSSTSFWNDTWLGEEAFKHRFKRLVRLENDMAATVKDRITSDVLNCKGNWSWVRAPSGHAKGELERLNELLVGAIINPSKHDTWRWRAGNNGNFTTKSLTILIEEKIIPLANNNVETLRNKLVPKKVEVFVWRDRRKRLPTLVELDKRGIDLHSVRCPICDDDIETVDHSLLLCKHVIVIWNKVFMWWGGGNFNPRNMGELLSNTGHVNSSVGKDIWYHGGPCGYDNHRYTDRGSNVNPRDAEIERLNRRIAELEVRQHQKYEDYDYEETGDQWNDYNTFDDHPRDDGRGSRDDPLRTLGINVEIPEFTGASPPNDFIEWISTVERVFDVKEIPDYLKVKLVAIKLKKHASLWWDHVKK